MPVEIKPLSLIPDEADIALHKFNCDVDRATERLHELVPLMRFVGGRFEQLSPSKTVLTAPLLENAMNQNGTHQASVFYLLADYTLGAAMFAALPGVYTVGFHDRCHALPVQGWLISGHVDHIRPGTGALRAEVSISPETALTMREGLARDGQYVLKHEIEIYLGDRLAAVAEHEIGLYADLPRAVDEAPDYNQLEKMKVSALMIAGLRDDAISRRLAGEQGIAVANRMAAATPQLPTLVRSRTAHAETVLQAGCFPQVLVLGAGLDPKPLKHASCDQVWYLADLPEMLKLRRERLEETGLGNSCAQYISVDLRTESWHKSILAAGFDPQRKTLIYFEGVSMYLTKNDLKRVLREAWYLSKCHETRFWFDHVTEAGLDLQEPEAVMFLQNMARLGEPFDTGFVDMAEFTNTQYWQEADSVTAAEISGIHDALHGEYRFATLRPLL